MTTAATLDVGWLLLCAALVLFMQAGFTALESGLVPVEELGQRRDQELRLPGRVVAVLALRVRPAVRRGRGRALRHVVLRLRGDGAFLTAFFLFQLGFIATATTSCRERSRSECASAATSCSPVRRGFAIPSSATGRGAPGRLRITVVRTAGSRSWASSTSRGRRSSIPSVVGSPWPRSSCSARGSALRRQRCADPRPRPSVATLGVFVLWVGWYGFNGGSLYGLTPDVPRVILNTTVAAALRRLAGMALTWLRDGRPDVVTIMNASLAGLVAITASARHEPLEGRDHRDRGCRRDGRGQARARTAPDRRRDRRGAGPPRGRCVGDLAVGLGGGQVPPAPGGSSRSASSSSASRRASSGRSASVTSSSRSSIDASRSHRRSGRLAGLNIAEHGATTEIADLLTDMDEHHRTGDFARPVRVEPHTEVGQIALEYNRVLGLRASHGVVAAAPSHRSSGERVVLGGGRLGGRARRGVPLHRLADRPRVPRQPRRPRGAVSTGIWRISDERYALSRSHRGRADSSRPGPRRCRAREATAGLRHQRRSDRRSGRVGGADGRLARSAGARRRGDSARGMRGRRAAEWLELGLRAASRSR